MNLGDTGTLPCRHPRTPYLGSFNARGTSTVRRHACGCALDLRPDMAMLSKRATIHGLSDLTLPYGTTSSVGTALRSAHQNARCRIGSPRFGAFVTYPSPCLAPHFRFPGRAKLRAAMGGFSSPMRVVGRHNIALHALTPRGESLYARARLVVESVAIFK
jgi:hypothetical protein